MCGTSCTCDCLRQACRDTTGAPEGFEYTPHMLREEHLPTVADAGCASSCCCNCTLRATPDHTTVDVTCGLQRAAAASHCSAAQEHASCPCCHGCAQDALQGHLWGECGPACACLARADLQRPGSATPHTRCNDAVVSSQAQASSAQRQECSRTSGGLAVRLSVRKGGKVPLLYYRTKS